MDNQLSINKKFPKKLEDILKPIWKKNNLGTGRVAPTPLLKEKISVLMSPDFR